MLLCADGTDRVALLDVPAGTKPGERVQFVSGSSDSDIFDAPDADPVVDLKKKGNPFGLVAPALSIDANGYATYAGTYRWAVGGGFIRAPKDFAGSLIR
jgi:hypothetical protein